MGSSRFGLHVNVADKESKYIPFKFPRSHWLNKTGQCVIERYLSATMAGLKPQSQVCSWRGSNIEGHEYVNER